MSNGWPYGRDRGGRAQPLLSHEYNMLQQSGLSEADMKNYMRLTGGGGGSIFDPSRIPEAMKELHPFIPGVPGEVMAGLQKTRNVDLRRGAEKSAYSGVTKTDQSGEAIRQHLGGVGEALQATRMENLQGFRIPFPARKPISNLHLFRYGMKFSRR